METVIGMITCVVWCGLGFMGNGIRVNKGYNGANLGPILWGGPLFFLAALALPPRNR